MSSRLPESGGTETRERGVKADPEGIRVHREAKVSTDPSPRETCAPLAPPTTGTTRTATTGQRSSIAVKVEPLYAAEAAARKARAGHDYGEGHPKQELTADLRQALDQGKREPRALDRAAASAGTSARSATYFKRIAKEAPDLAERMTFAPELADAVTTDTTNRVRSRSDVDYRERHPEVGHASLPITESHRARGGHAPLSTTERDHA